VRHLPRRSDVHGRRDGVVGRLAHIHMVVRVHRRLAPPRARQNLVRTPGQDLVGVHVRLRARPALPDGQGEGPGERAVRDLLRRLHNGLGHARLQQAQVGVHLRRRLFDKHQRPDRRRGPGFGANREVGQRPGRLRAPVGLGGHLNGAQSVGFGACGHALPSRGSVAGRCYGWPPGTSIRSPRGPSM